MSLSREIFRKGEASAMSMFLEDEMVSRMLRPSADHSDSYHKNVLVWRVTNPPNDLPALSNVISSSNTTFRRLAESRNGSYPSVAIDFK